MLTIAGSDPSGGAGIQADLKVFAAFGCFGMAVPAALTVQAPTGVREVFLELPEAEGHDIAWWVTHQRVAFPRGPNPASAVLEGETPMAGGVLEG